MDRLRYIISFWREAVQITHMRGLHMKSTVLAVLAGGMLSVMLSMWFMPTLEWFFAAFLGGILGLLSWYIVEICETAFLMSIVRNS